MTEYIKREDALSASKLVYIECLEDDKDGFIEAEADYIPVVFKRDIEAIPAADVRPVVKAKWAYTNMSRLVCSNCGNPVAFSLKEDGWHHGDFCPNCGADMRGEDDV